MDDKMEETSLSLWLAAINARGDQALTDAAFSADAVVERYGFGEQEGQRVQTITGTADINSWLRMSPDGTVFSVSEPPRARAEDGAIDCGYRLSVAGFSGGGLWRWWVADDGKIARLRHLPAALNDPIVEETDKPFSWRVLAHSLGRDED